jgi:pimeloyl-ACP methyl ester carboxylesterase
MSRPIGKKEKGGFDMPQLETPSGTLHYDLCDVVPPWIGQPETIIFHHGIAADMQLWAGWMPTLAPRFRLVRFDLRGFGTSVRPPHDFPWSFDVLVDDLLHIADHVQAERFHLLGESIGGTVAIACALKAPRRVQTLTLSNAAARGGLVGNVTSWREIVARSGQDGWAAQMMQWRFYPDALEPEVRAWYTELHRTCSLDATFALADLLLATDLTPRLSEIQIPALLLAPDASPFIPPQAMLALRDSLPQAELQIFAHSKHGLPLSHARPCAEAFSAFLQRTGMLHT